MVSRTGEVCWVTGLAGPWLLAFSPSIPPLLLVAICHGAGVSRGVRSDAGSADCVHGSWSHRAACIGRGVH